MRGIGLCPKGQAPETQKSFSEENVRCLRWTFRFCSIWWPVRKILFLHLVSRADQSSSSGFCLLGPPPPKHYWWTQLHYSWVIAPSLHPVPKENQGRGWASTGRPWSPCERQGAMSRSFRQKCCIISVSKHLFFVPYPSLIFVYLFY